MSTLIPDQNVSTPAYQELLQAELLRKAAAEADLAELQAQQKQAQVRQELKSAADAPPSPGIIPNQQPEPQKPPTNGTATDPINKTNQGEPYEGNARPREGTVTLDEKAGYLSTIIAYRAILRHADAVAQAVSDLHLQEARIMLVDSIELAAGDVGLLQLDAHFKAWAEELQSLNNALEELLEQEKPKALSSVVPFVLPALAGLFGALNPATLAPLLLGTVGATADLLGYFKTDYNISGRDVSVSDMAVRARVAGKISGVSVYLQDFYRIDISPLINQLNTLVRARGALQHNLVQVHSQVIDPLALQIAGFTAGIEQRQAEIKRLKSPVDAQRMAKLEKEIADLQEKLRLTTSHKQTPDELAAQAAAAITLFDTFRKELTAVTDKGLSTLVRAALRDYWKALGITHLLYVTVSSAGGEIVTGKNWFLGKPQVGYLAGGAVTFLLCDLTGAICAADTFTGTDYLKFELGQDVLR